MSLEEWTKRVTEQEMPALSTTAQEIAKLSEDMEQPLSRLADIILQDAAMTMNVLRLTDSAYHIPRKNKMNTISRALVMLGFDEIRSLCLSVAVFDPLLKNSNTQLTKEMARAFHAATQAQALAVQMGDRASQEVFIATLLYNLGDMMFWCFGGEQVEDLAYEMEETGCTKEEAEVAVLGFPLRQLTLALGKKWGLGKLLESAVTKDTDDPRCQAINLSQDFSRAIAGGWDSKEVKALTEEMSNLINTPAEGLTSMLKSNIEEASKTAERFGAPLVGDEISHIMDDQTEESELYAEEDSTQTHVFLEPDPMFQLKILRDITLLLEEGASVSDILEMILEGIYQGIGVDRALFALLSPNRKYLRAKSAHGMGQFYLSRNFKFELSPEEPTVFDRVFEAQQAIWIAERSSEQSKILVPPHVTKVIGECPFFLAPTIVDGQPIGVFYADRYESKRELDDNAFESFKQFALQANMALEHLGKY